MGKADAVNDSNGIARMNSTLHPFNLPPDAEMLAALCKDFHIAVAQARLDRLLAQRHATRIPGACLPSLRSLRIQALVLEREQACEALDFARADALRVALEAEGFILQQTLKGTVLRPAGKIPL